MTRHRLRVAATLAVVFVAVVASVASSKKNEAQKVNIVEGTEPGSTMEDPDSPDGSGKVASSGTSKGRPEPTDVGRDEPDEPTTFAIGDTVELDDWELIVHSIEDPLAATNRFLTPDEGNRFIGVDVEVVNNSSEPESVSSILCFEVQDSDNRAYTISITAPTGGATIDGEVAPGAARRGDLGFEVPETSEGFALNFKCDLFSTGSATVALD